MNRTTETVLAALDEATQMDLMLITPGECIDAIDAIMAGRGGAKMRRDIAHVTETIKQFGAMGRRVACLVCSAAVGGLDEVAAWVLLLPADGCQASGQAGGQAGGMSGAVCFACSDAAPSPEHLLHRVYDVVRAEIWPDAQIVTHPDVAGHG